MAIQGDYIWDVTKYNPSTTLGTVDWKERVAVRWAEMLGYTPATLKPLLSGLSEPAAGAALDGTTDVEKLLRPGYYPKIVSGAVTVMADGLFPNIINHRGEFRSPDGILGLPEINEFEGKGKSITDPAV